MKVNRRNFLKASAAFAGWSILPSGAWSSPLNSRFCTAHIGLGSMGRGDLRKIGSHSMVQVVGLADVSRQALQHKGVQPFKDATQFVDYREMLRTLGDKVDGVVVSTPDHTHYPAALMAMNMDKAVYCQKPMTHEISETRALASLAKEKNLITQLGIQVHSGTAYRMAVDFVQQGIIGKVSKVYAWSGKKWGADVGGYPGSDPVPEWLDWNQWIGSAPFHPYLKGKYHPGQWRKIIDFGTGTLGDMGVHIMDTPFTALNLSHPKSVKASCREPNGFSHPVSSTVEYEFPGTEYTADTLKFTWFDGNDSPHKKKQSNPDLQLEGGKDLPRQGAMFIGEDGHRLLLPHVAAPQPLPRKLLTRITKPKLKRVNHYHQWVDAAMGKDTCSADFKYGALLTAGVLHGVVGNRFPGETLLWDNANMRYSNNEAASQLLSRDYRTDY